MKGFRLSLLGLPCAGRGFVTAKAELPPSDYEQFQADAPEVFQTQVDQVSSKFPDVFDRAKRIESVEATVVKIVRGKSGTISVRGLRTWPMGVSWICSSCPAVVTGAYFE